MLRIDHLKTIQKERHPYEKTDLEKDKYLISSENTLKMYYAPFEYINTNASIIIVGITPGWTQMEKGYKTFIECLSQGLSVDESMKSVKKEASFSGSMRNNLIKMLDELKLNHKLNLNSTSDMFNTNNSIIHSTSLLKYPVFFKDRNYTGTTPSPLSNTFLWDFIASEFTREINTFSNKLIIPLGTTVIKVLQKLAAEHLITTNNIILDKFPHPSGANGHRKKQFEDHKQYLMNQLSNWNV